MSTETTSTLSAVAKTYYERLLLERLIARFLHGQFADEGRDITIPGMQGKTVEWRRWAALAAATTPLTEGTTPAGNNNSVAQVTATPAQYGDFVIYSDVLDMVGIDPFLATMAGVFGDQAGDTLDQIARNVLAAGTNVQYAGGVGARGSVAASNKFSSDELLLAVRTLENANVPKIADEFGGSYIAFVSAYTAYDLRQDPLWNRASEYGGAVQLFSGELGRLHGVRFMQTSNAKVFAGAGSGSIDVHATLIFGAHWYGRAKWVQNDGGKNGNATGGEPVQFYVKAIGSSGTADPLNQRGSTGWKVNAVFKILNDSCGVRVEHSVS